jgi:hypothetical protein
MVSFKRVNDEMVPTGPAEWVYRSYKVERAEENKAEAELAKPLGRIIRITPQGDNAYINLGTADNIRPKMTFRVYAAGSTPANNRPKASLDVLSVPGRHLALTEVTWLRDPEREPLIQGDLLFKSASAPIADIDGDKAVQELIHQYRALSERDKLGQEGERIKSRILDLSQSEQVTLSPVTRDAAAATVAEHVLRGDLREVKNKQINEAVKSAVDQVRAEQIRLIAEDAKAQRDALQKQLREKEQKLQELKEKETRLRQQLQSKDAKSPKTKELMLSRDKLPADAEILAPLLRQLARQKYHEDRFEVRVTDPHLDLFIEGPNEIVDWASNLIALLNKADKKP